MNHKKAKKLILLVVLLAFASNVFSEEISENKLIDNINKKEAEIFRSLTPKDSEDLNTTILGQMHVSDIENSFAPKVVSAKTDLPKNELNTISAVQNSMISNTASVIKSTPVKTAVTASNEVKPVHNAVLNTPAAVAKPTVAAVPVSKPVQAATAATTPKTTAAKQAAPVVASVKHASTPAAKITVKESIVKQSMEMGMDPALALSIAKLESNFDHSKRSPHGAVGVFQIMPSTAKRLGYDPYKVNENIKGALTYYQMMYKKFGTMDLALAAYNAGPGNVAKYKGVPPFSETKRFINSIKNEYANQKTNPDPAIAKMKNSKS